MKRTFVKVYCDACGSSTDPQKPWQVDAMAREKGWLFTNEGKHFCSKDCRRAWRAAQQIKKKALAASTPNAVQGSKPGHCVACAKPSIGMYGDTDVCTCLGCYKSGRLKTWLRRHRPELL